MKINKDYLVTDRNKHGGKRKKPVRVFIPHHNSGVATGLDLAKYMKETKRPLSAHYVIGQEGEIFQTLDESLEPYTTGNRAIDTEAITFEIVNSKGAPTWEVSDKAFKSLVELSIDIAKRYDIKQVNYTGDKKGSVQLHKWYQNTNCPGPYLEAKMPEYASLVNKGLNAKPTKPNKPVSPKPTKKTIAQLADEVNAGKWGNGKARFDGLTKAGYDAQAVQDEVNRRLGIKVDKPAPVKPKPVAKTDKQLAQEVIDGKHGNGDARKKSLGDRFSAVQAEVNKILYGTASPKPKPTPQAIKMGDRVVLSSSATHYATGQGIPSTYKGKTYTVLQTRTGQVLLKELYSWVRLVDVSLVGSKPKPQTPLRVGDKVKIASSATRYATGQLIPATYKNKWYTVQQLRTNQALIKELYSWVFTKDIVK